MILSNSIPEHYCEIDYLNQINSILSKKLDDSFVVYIIHNDLTQHEKKNISRQIRGYTKKIAIHISDEYGSTDLYNLFDLVFRFYHSNLCDNKKVFNINIGYNCSGNTNIQFNNKIPLSERKKKVFFSGQYRSDLSNAIKTLKNKYDISFTSGFRQGLSINDYIQCLSESKICLVPRGISPETFRYSESFASGCIVITTENINTWYYKDSPAYFLNNWNELSDDLIENILGSNIDNKYLLNIDYYKKRLSPEANAQYIENICKI
jgi:hypothetical protein